MVGLPEALAVRVTRPRALDALVRWCSRPPVAVLLVTVCAVATLTTGAVDAAARDPLLRAAFDAVLLGAGSVLWLPVVRGFPGTHRPSALGRAGYLIVQSIVPSFLAIVWIFARHPLYPAFAHSATIGGVSATLDQQLAGFVAKFATIAILWVVAFVGLTRAHALGAAGDEADPLRWADVERQFRTGRPGAAPPQRLAPRRSAERDRRGVPRRGRLIDEVRLDPPASTARAPVSRVSGAA